jgi:hypothetical protein
MLDSLMLQLRHYAQKRLTTTVEEDNSNREYYEEVKVGLCACGIALLRQPHL